MKLKGHTDEELGRELGSRASSRKLDEPTLKQLRLLLVVSRTHSLRAAARKLGVSQATVSEGARELERRCGFEVFDRGFYNTYVAHECRYVLEQARRVLDEYEKLLDMIAKVGRRLAIRDRP